jgi:outer membrane protein assembly factor BamB
LVLIAAVALLASSCDWTIFGYDVGNSRNNPYDGSMSSQNVGTIARAWTGAIGASAGSSSPVTGNGEVYIGGQNGVLDAFDENGVINCNGGYGCTPEWSSAAEGTPVSSPAVSGSTVFIGAGGQLYAYDANGSTNCSGSPTTCQPLWSSPVTANGDMSTPTVSGNVLYVHDSANLYAFDATGNTNCSGTPKVCSPLWTAPGLGSTSATPPAVDNGVVFTVGGGKLYAVDANGATNCSGTPTTCQPLWTANSASDQFGVTAVGSTVYTAGSTVYAYDATGNTNCTGTKKVCRPLWTGSVGGQAFSPMAVANGVLFVEGNGDLVALDANGKTNCSASRVCQPLWTGPIGAAQSSANLNSAPASANGVVYIGSDDHKVYAFDATGSANCSGTPKTCQPLAFSWTGDMVRSSPAIANGALLVGSNDGNLYVLGHPADYVNVTGSPLTGLTTSPGLNIPFSQSAMNYAISCPSPENSVTLNLTAAGGTISAEGQSGSTITTTELDIAPNQAIVVQAPDPSNPTGATVQYWIRCLPGNFPQLQVSKPGNPAPGYYFYGNLTVSANSGWYEMALDQNGTPVWYTSTIDAEDVTPLANDQIAANILSTFYVENLDTLTNQTVTVPTGPTDGHEYLVEPNGDRMIIGVPVKTGVDLSALGDGTNQDIVDCDVQELDPQGNVVWSWTASQHVGINETMPSLFTFDTTTASGRTFPQPVGDPYHCNSVDVDPTGTQVLISFRDTSAVYDVDKATGKILWKLGGNANVNDGEQYISIQNDPETTFSGQHDARFQPGGDISLYDDHTNLPGAARGVQYHVDTTTGTATPDFQYANPDGQNTFATGSFRRDPDGGNVIGWGFHTGSGFTEVDDNGNVLLDVKFPNGESGYRTIKVPASAFNINLLRDTVNAPVVAAP